MGLGATDYHGERTGGSCGLNHDQILQQEQEMADEIELLRARVKELTSSCQLHAVEHREWQGRAEKAEAEVAGLHDIVDDRPCCDCQGTRVITGQDGASNVSCPLCDGTGQCACTREAVDAAKGESDENKH